MGAPELWDDQARAADILRERAGLIQATAEYAARRQQLEDLKLMFRLMDSVQEDPRTIVLTIQARFDGRHAEQTARYIRDEKGWKLVSAELVAT